MLLATALVAVLAACGNGNGGGPVTMAVQDARLVDHGVIPDTRTLAVLVEFENGGRAPVHVSYNSVRVLPDQGDPLGFGAFRGEVEPLFDAALNSTDADRMVEDLKAIGYNEPVPDELIRMELEVLPDERRQVLLAFTVDTPELSRWLTLDLRYHYDGTDRISRAQRPFVLEE